MAAASGWPAPSAMAKAVIARLPAGAGQDEIAEAGEAGKGGGLRPEGLAEPGHLGKGAGGERRARQLAEAAAIGNAAGNGHDVFEGAADLDAPEVVRGVDAEGGLGQGGGDGGCLGAIGRRPG